MTEFEFFVRILEAARLYRATLLQLEEGGLNPRMGDTTGEAAQAANTAFGRRVADYTATAWDDPVAHVTMWVEGHGSATPEYLAQNAGWEEAFTSSLTAAYAAVTADHAPAA